MGANYDKWFKTRYLGWRIFKPLEYVEAVLRPVLTRDRAFLSEDQNRIFTDTGIDLGRAAKDQDVYLVPNRYSYRWAFRPRNSAYSPEYVAELSRALLIGLGHEVRYHYAGWRLDWVDVWITKEEWQLIRDDETCQSLRTNDDTDDYYWGVRGAKLLDLTITIPDRVTTAELRIED